MLEAILKILFKFPKECKVVDINFNIEKAVPGKVCRECATIHLPTQYPPYDKTNWGRKICAIVIFGFKILNFTVARPVTYEGNK